MAWKTLPMILAAKTTKRPPGFTLIEVVIVLAIATIIMGSAAGFLIYSSDERLLRDASGEIEVLAKRARMTAILQQTPYAVEFREGVVRVLPFAQAGQDEKKTVGGHRIGGQPSLPPVSEDRQFVLKEGMRVSVRRWNSEEWFSTLKDTVHVWRFDPNGLCEPISVRLNLEKGWSEDVYHPLTASIRYSQLEAR
jgi:prepilin-type N-terminal cleavage/methylation domain-containing protein